MGLTKSQMINRIAELAQENAELQGKLDAYQMSEKEANEIIAELKAENKKLKKELKNNKSEYQLELNTYNIECGNLLEENKELAHYLACMTERRNKANTILQGIKTIVCGNYEIIDPQGRKDILKLITKAEEE